MNLYAPALDAGDRRFAVVVSRYNQLISVALLEACEATLVSHGAESSQIDVAWVPGAYEIPQAARALAETGRYAGIITLGSVIRGGTPHFEYVCQAAAEGVREVIRDTGVPVAFGVLTTDDIEQALARSGGEHGNKGEEAALAALEMAVLGPLLAEPPEGSGS